MRITTIDGHDRMRAQFVYEFARRNKDLVRLVTLLREKLREKFHDKVLIAFEAFELMESNYARWAPKDGDNFPFHVVQPATDLKNYLLGFVRSRRAAATAAPFNWYHLAVFSGFPNVPWPTRDERPACEHLAKALKPQIHNRRGLTDVSIALHELIEVTYGGRAEDMPSIRFAEDWVRHRTQDGLWAAAFLLDFDQCSTKEMVALFKEWASGIEKKTKKDVRRHRSRQIGYHYMPFELPEALDALNWVEKLELLKTKNTATHVTFLRYEMAKKSHISSISLRPRKPADLASVPGGEIPAKRRSEKIKFVNALVEWFSAGGTPPRFR